MNDKIIIKGAREHNLRNIDLEIPRDKMTVITGLSGSGKSSLAFDTIFAEGQRRYIESLSSYARQFLEKTQKPDVDEITGLSPSISIDQKSHSRNPRSIVATITEIYDFLRVLYARCGTPYCPICSGIIQKITKEQIVEQINSKEDIMVMAPIIRGRKGEYYQLLYDLLNKGFVQARIDGKIHNLREQIILNKNKKHNIELIIDTIPKGTNLKDKNNRSRLAESIEFALEYGEDLVMINDRIYSVNFSCPNDGFSFPEIEPRLFSFNSPYGACPECHGLGIENIYSNTDCPTCLGKRLNNEALSVKINDKNIMDVISLTIEDAWVFFEDIKEDEVNKAPLREIKNRLKFLLDVGLDYLTLNRKAGTLSGGEAQRIRLASQISSQLTGTLYVLDEPTIGLHQKDNDQLIKTLQELKDLGNTIIVVEHDEQTIRSSDYLIDIGPGPGVHGGQVVTTGEIPDIFTNKNKQSLTLDYLRGDKKIEVSERRSVDNLEPKLILKGITKNNIKGLNVKVPLKKLVVLTGVSGSGKSTLMNDVLYNATMNRIYRFSDKPEYIEDIKGGEYLSRIIDIDQSPIGRSSRSNPVTYVGAWDGVRDLFALTEEARARGYKKGRFSFNKKGGRCESCEGLGRNSIEMHFLPTVYVRCEICKGKRYDRETLEVKYKNKHIYDILDMTVEEGLKFFYDLPWIKDKLQMLDEVGLGYLKLGQSSTTLSGGEAQRVKLAKELSRPQNKNTLYLLDEPTTGLHFEDIKKLIEVLQKLVDKGNTVMVIEHNLDVIKCADWIIDLGPEGGRRGGNVVVAGTPETVSKHKTSYTGKYLKDLL